MAPRGRPRGGAAAIDRDMDAFGDRENADLRRQVEYLTRQLADLTHRRHDEEDDNTDNPFGEDPDQGDRQDRRWELGFRVDIPDFDGGLRAEEFIDWLSQVEEVLEFKGVPDDRRVALVTIRLRGRAQAWWQQLKKSRVRAGKEKIRSWEKFKKKISKAFLSYNFERELFQRFQNLRQGPHSVEDYTTDFYQLLARTERLASFENLFTADKGTEEVHYEPMYDEPIFDEYPEEEILDGDGHENLVVRKILFVEDNEAEEDSEGLEYGAPKYDEYADDNVCCGDGHESLGVRKSLLIPKGCSPDDCLRNNTTCTIKGNIVTMIVDGSNCDNIISDETVEKLKFRTEPQPKPYKLSWLNKGSEVIVDKRCLVSFSIGKTHHAGHWCDVEKMVHALIPDEIRTNDGSSELPIAGRELLDAFANLMPEDLPPDPPPLRDKLNDREVGPCKVVQKINNRLRLPNHLKTSDVFSVKHLTRCFEELGMQMWTRGRVLSHRGSLMQEHPKKAWKAWDQRLPQAEFAHNHALSRSTGFCHFQVVYGITPRGPVDLLALPSKVRSQSTAEEMVAQIQRTHKQTHDQLTQNTAKYKASANSRRRPVEFEVGDYVWAVLTKDRYPVHEYSKLAARKIGPVEIVEKINPNAYRLRLPSHVTTSDVFNVKHLIPYMGDSSDEEPDSNSRANLLYPGGDDADGLALEFMETKDHPKQSAK